MSDTVTYTVYMRSVRSSSQQCKCDHGTSSLVGTVSMLGANMAVKDSDDAYKAGVRHLRVRTLVIGDSLERGFSPLSLLRWLVGLRYIV